MPPQNLLVALSDYFKRLRAFWIYAVNYGMT